MGSVRWGAVVAIAGVLGGVGLSISPGRSGAVRAPSGQRTVQLSVGYENDQALAAALRTTDAVLVRRLAALHVAEVRTTAPGRVALALRHAPGIHFVQRAAARLDVSDPGLTLAAVTPHARWEWQYRATHEDAVPASVLRAAASLQIAVVDTGADLGAPDLAAKAPAAYNTRTGDADVSDANGHGTFVASLAAGSVTNDDGISGAGGDAQLLVVKAGNANGEFTDIDEAAGITYAVDHGAKIINLSVGGTTTSTTEQRAIRYAVDRGVLLVAAVGNEYDDGNPVEYPAALLQPIRSDGVGGVGLAVTASSSNGLRAPFANAGSWVSLAAPGENVFGAVSKDATVSAYPRSALPGSQSGLYGYASGTSFAAPQVAGAAALVWAANPSLTAQQVAQILKQTASGGGRWSPELGFGVIDVAAAVARAQAGAPGVLLSGDRTDRGMRLNWAGGDVRYRLSLSKDSNPWKTVIADTQQTRATFTLERGHGSSFVVTALDATGVATSTSMPLTITMTRRP
jgi:subtilisin family serine protease